MTTIRIENHGPLITASDFWGSDRARAGLIYASVHAGAIRLLLPAKLWSVANEMRAARYVVCSRGPWAGVSEDGVELMFETEQAEEWRPVYTMHLLPSAFDVLPGAPPPGREWIVSVWTAKRQLPHKTLERLCHWRRVGQIPCLEPWTIPGEE